MTISQDRRQHFEETDQPINSSELISIAFEPYSSQPLQDFGLGPLEDRPLQGSKNALPRGNVMSIRSAGSPRRRHALHVTLL